MTISKALQSHLVKLGIAQATWTDPAMFASAAADALEAGTLTPAKFAELQGQTTPADVFGGARVKKAAERYSREKSAALHVKTKQPVLTEKGVPAQNISQLEMAKSGALLKKIAQRSGLPVSLNEHEAELLEECYQDDWCGKLGSEFQTGIPGARVKSLLNDSLSGGVDVTPEWFDEAIVTFPLLHSELLPKIDLRDVPRGSNVEAASIGTPTATWGVPEGTPQGTFDTASLIAGIDTSIHPVSVAVEIGRDFLSDAAVDVGRVLLEVIGQRMLSELDRVIVLGNGTTEPAGIFNAAGITDIGNPAGGAGAVPQVDDYEALYFAVGKPYRANPTMNCCFFSNDTTYRRARGIPVGAADERRVFGMAHSDYTLLDRPFLVCNDIGNACAGFGALNRYRLYRRQAQEVRFIDQGKELALKNQVLLIVRGRFGGKVVDGAAFAYCDNMQA